MPIAPVKVDEIVSALHCELASVYADAPSSGAFFYGWAAGAELNLVVSNTTSGTPGLTLRPPVSGGKLAMPGSTGFSDTAKREFKFRDFISMGGLDPRTATGVEVRANCPPLSPRSESMGLGEALRELARADARDGAGHIQLDQSSMIVTFTAGRSVDGGLTFETTMFTATLNSAKVSRTLENKITITFVKDPNPPPLVPPDAVMMLGTAPPSSSPSKGTIERLNKALDKLTEDKGIQLKPGDKLVVE